jgi:hypothetical protein
MDQEIVGRRNVLVSENRNDSLEFGHDALLRSHGPLTTSVHPRRLRIARAAV